MEPGESGIETLSETESLAVVGIESEPAPGGAQTLFEQREGRWVGNVEGSETELTMQDEQVLTSVLSLQQGEPAIINTAEGFNLSGEPVTWTAIYEHTNAGIMTTHLEEPRDISRGLGDASQIEDDGVFTAPEIGTFQRQQSVFESPIFSTETEDEEPQAKGQLWFERDSKTNEDAQAGSVNADIIDFFSKGHLFEAAKQPGAEVEDSTIQSESQPIDPAEEAGKTNVIEALFGQTQEEVVEITEDPAVDEPEPIQNNVVELFVGSAELVEAPSTPQIDEAAPGADSNLSAAEVVQPIGEIESVPEIVSSHLSEAASDSDIDQDLSTATSQVEEVVGSIELAESTAEDQVINLEPADAEEEVELVTQIAEPPGELPALDLKTDEITALSAEQPGLTLPEATIETAEESPVEIDVTDNLEAPAEVAQEPVSVATELTLNPTAIPEAEVLIEVEPGLAEITNQEEPRQVVSTETRSVEQITQAVDANMGAEVVPEPELIAQEPEAEPSAAGRESVPPSEDKPARLTDEPENVIRLETSAPDELNLSASDWIAEFGAPAEVVIEPEPVVVTSVPKPEVRIRRHESGMLDITVTFEAETEIETQTQTKAKKPAHKTMRRAA